jgi:hypothetical protein
MMVPLAVALSDDRLAGGSHTMAGRILFNMEPIPTGDARASSSGGSGGGLRSSSTRLLRDLFGRSAGYSVRRVVRQLLLLLLLLLLAWRTPPCQLRQLTVKLIRSGMSL